MTKLTRAAFLRLIPGAAVVAKLLGRPLEADVYGLRTDEGPLT